MESVTLPKQYSEQFETIAGYSVRITSYQLWESLYAKGKTAIEGIGKWVARSEASTWVETETRVIGEVQILFMKRG